MSFSETILKKVIGKLMMQIEEERRLRQELVALYLGKDKYPEKHSDSIKEPTDVEVDSRIRELF